MFFNQKTPDLVEIKKQDLKKSQCNGLLNKFNSDYSNIYRNPNKNFNYFNRINYNPNHSNNNKIKITVENVDSSTNFNKSQYINNESFPIKNTNFKKINSHFRQRSHSFKESKLSIDFNYCLNDKILKKKKSIIINKKSNDLSLVTNSLEQSTSQSLIGQISDNNTKRFNIESKSKNIEKQNISNKSQRNSQEIEVLNEENENQKTLLKNYQKEKFLQYNKQITKEQKEILKEYLMRINKNFLLYSLCIDYNKFINIIKQSINLIIKKDTMGIMKRNFLLYFSTLFYQKFININKKLINEMNSQSHVTSNKYDSDKNNINVSMNVNNQNDQNRKILLNRDFYFILANDTMNYSNEINNRII